MECFQEWRELVDVLEQRDELVILRRGVVIVVFSVCLRSGHRQKDPGQWGQERLEGGRPNDRLCSHDVLVVEAGQRLDPPPRPWLRLPHWARLAQEAPSRDPRTTLGAVTSGQTRESNEPLEKEASSNNLSLFNLPYSFNPGFKIIFNLQIPWGWKN